MGKLHDTYKLTITTLSPLHIGTGNTLRQGYDYVTPDEKTWVLDVDVLAETLHRRSDKTLFNKMVTGTSADELLQPEDYQEGSELFRYVMPGKPEKPSNGIREQIKDPWDRPYIPGSSLKGAIRTVLLYSLWRKQVVPPGIDLAKPAERAAEGVERQLLRGLKGEPNDDLLRALVVSDSTPGSHVSLQNVCVEGGHEIIMAVEAIPRGTELQATLSIDRFLIGSPNAPTAKLIEEKLGWTGAECLLLEDLRDKAIKWALARWKAELQYWEQREQRLAKILGKPESNEFFLQLGWGGGWLSKTLGDALQQDPDQFADIVKNYQSKMDPHKHFKAGAIFPKTRRYVPITKDGEEVALPLGWIKVKMERV
ncbi:MAG: type III-A CRISPR-associated RAMP protein Csm5 [Anaerolineales bacterium]|nr:type III-A CRISPR-associated RAMP protein Csm5 [Anaerolineales bacterium]